MHRRDFLLLRQPSSPRVIDIHCERLHMSYLDLLAAEAPPERPAEASFAEPAAVLPRRGVDDWFATLAAELSDANVIRVVGAEWLQPDALRDRVDGMLRRLEHRGVRIERGGAG